jgi:hypothetical protein
MLDVFTANLRAATMDLTAREIAIGKDWYPAAFARLVRKTVEYPDVSGWTLVYAAACLSPGLSWEATLETLTVLLDARLSGAVTFPRRGVHATFGFRGHERAWEILTTDVDPTTIARGPKVEAFVANLLGDLTTVTVDRHVCRAAGLVGSLVKGRIARTIPQPTSRQVGEITAALRAVAPLRSLQPAELQAALWAASARGMDKQQSGDAS